MVVEFSHSFLSAHESQQTTTANNEQQHPQINNNNEKKWSAQSQEWKQMALSLAQWSKESTKTK